MIQSIALVLRLLILLFHLTKKHELNAIQYLVLDMEWKLELELFV